MPAGGRDGMAPDGGAAGAAPLAGPCARKLPEGGIDWVAETDPGDGAPPLRAAPSDFAGPPAGRDPVRTEPGVGSLMRLSRSPAVSAARSHRPRDRRPVACHTQQAMVHTARPGLRGARRAYRRRSP